MNYDKIKQIDVENNIWIIYIGIIILSWYSNSLEKDYFINNNIGSRDKYRQILILIFTILIVVYYYFLKSSYDDLRNLNEFDSDKKKNLVYLSFIGSLLIFISGLLFLYISYNDEELNVEIAFN